MNNILARQIDGWTNDMSVIGPGIISLPSTHSTAFFTNNNLRINVSQSLPQTLTTTVSVAAATTTAPLSTIFYSSNGFIFDETAFLIPLGLGLSTLSLLTFLGNAMVVHAIRTERKLHTVSWFFYIEHLKYAERTNFKRLLPNVFWSN